MNEKQLLKRSCFCQMFFFGFFGKDLYRRSRHLTQTYSLKTPQSFFILKFILQIFWKHFVIFGFLAIFNNQLFLLLPKFSVVIKIIQFQLVLKLLVFKNNMVNISSGWLLIFFIEILIQLSVYLSRYLSSYLFSLILLRSRLFTLAWSWY